MKLPEAEGQCDCSHITRLIGFAAKIRRSISLF